MKKLRSKSYCKVNKKIKISKLNLNNLIILDGDDRLLTYLYKKAG
jgi:hypothetical protein